MEIHPCPTGHRPFGAAALLSLHFFSYHFRQGIGYRWPYAILGWLVFPFSPFLSPLFLSSSFLLPFLPLFFFFLNLSQRPLNLGEERKLFWSFFFIECEPKYQKSEKCWLSLMFQKNWREKGGFSVVDTRFCTLSPCWPLVGRLVGWLVAYIHILLLLVTLFYII